MAARAGMANLIARLRGMTDTATGQYTVDGVAWWSDDQLQDVLDRYRTDLERAPMRAVSEYDAGDTIYRDYYAPEGYGDFEEPDTGAEAWHIEDGDGNAIGSGDYTANYVNGHVRFAADQAGETRYLRARSYDLNRAAAHVWRMKAAHAVRRFDIRTDNHTLSRSQIRKGCLEMAAYYAREAGPQHVTMRRSDLY